MWRSIFKGPCRTTSRSTCKSALFCGECVERCILENCSCGWRPAAGLSPEVNASLRQLIARGKEDRPGDDPEDLPSRGSSAHLRGPCEANCHRGKTTGSRSPSAPSSATSLKGARRAAQDARPPGARWRWWGPEPAEGSGGSDWRSRGNAVSLLDAARVRADSCARPSPPSAAEEVVSQELGLLVKLGVRFSGGVGVTTPRGPGGLEAKFVAVSWRWAWAAAAAGDRRRGTRRGPSRPGASAGLPRGLGARPLRPGGGYRRGQLGGGRRPDRPAPGCPAGDGGESGEARPDAGLRFGGGRGRGRGSGIPGHMGPRRWWAARGGAQGGAPALPGGAGRDGPSAPASTTA